MALLTSIKNFVINSQLIKMKMMGKEEEEKHTLYIICVLYLWARCDRG